VHEDTLLFGPRKEEVEGRIHLAVAQVISVVDDPITFLVHTGTETLRVRAHSIDERIRWFKKLKKMQREISEASYAREVSSMSEPSGKSNKIKMLQAIVVELWQAHAELENQIEELPGRFKSMPAVRGLTDQVRMTVQAIKLKNSEALKIIEEYAETGSRRRGRNRLKGSLFDIQEDYAEQSSVDPDGTKYMSFDECSLNLNGLPTTELLHKKSGIPTMNTLKDLNLSNKSSSTANKQ
jgi:hypothetical protein